ncbi:helix-turn-helix domain-containing protein [Allocoleopsis sp.]
MGVGGRIGSLFECHSSVAQACGFAHQSHLNRHFKQLTGVTPKTLLKF